MARQAVQLFVHVQPLKQQRQLLFEPIAVHVDLQLGEALIQPRANAGMYLGKPCAHVRDQRFQRRAARLEKLPQSSTLACAR